tara:strand:+ start:18971 stop:19726 length:756 start_codon:yes stop_codon:yes gene_type:complete
MITIFRKIRQKLIANNSASKYLLYAIGEIILVVIGILIALQINNNNDERKEKKELQEYLAKISNNLELDIANLKDIKKRRLIVIQNCQLAVKNFNTNKFDLGTNMKAAQAFVDFYFVPNQSGYDALKNSSYLGKINGSKVDRFLDNYHVVLNKVLKEENSYLTYVENMEVIWTSSFDMSELKKVYDMGIKNIALKNLSVDLQKKIIPMFEHESFRSTITRSSFQTNMLTYYDDLINVGDKIINEIEKFIND